jgi:hypothetical protein
MTTPRSFNWVASWAGNDPTPSRSEQKTGVDSFAGAPVGLIARMSEPPFCAAL